MLLGRNAIFVVLFLFIFFPHILTCLFLFVIIIFRINLHIKYFSILCRHYFLIHLFVPHHYHHCFLFYFFRRIKISFPSDVRRTQLEDIPMLSAGQQISMPFEIVLAGLGGTVLTQIFFILFSFVIFIFFVFYYLSSPIFVPDYFILCIYFLS